MYVFSIALIIGVNLLYNVCQKSTPVGILAYREGFSPVKIFGVALSLTGLVLVNL